MNGQAGIESFKTNPGNYKSAIRSWALDNKDFMYDGQSLKPAEAKSVYPAVIDTGSSFLAVPPEQFQGLKQKWAGDVKDLDCKSDQTFC